MPSDVLDRVRKLLALATSPNLHEAAAAAARAQRLIDEHRLQDLLDAEKQPDIQDARDQPIESSRRLRAWKTALAGVLARASGCVAYTLVQGREQTIVLVGRKSDRDAVTAMYGALVAQVEWLSATQGPGQTKKWHHSFRLGAVHTIGQALSRTPKPGASTSSNELVHTALVSHRTAVQDFVAERLDLTPGKRVTVLTSAWEQGRQASQPLADTLKP